MRLTMPASTLPGPHSTMCVTPRARMRLHDLDPAHRAEGLAHERVADRGGIGLDRDVDVVDDRNLRRRESTSSPAAPAAARPPASSGSNGTAPTPAAAARAWRPCAFSTSQAFSTRGLAAGDHGLRRIVEVDRFDRLRRAAPKPHCLGAAGDAPVGVQAQDRGHRAGADRHRLLHRLRAKAHQRHRIAPASARRRRPAPMYSPSEWPATTAGSAPPSAQPGAIAGDAGDQHHRLRVGRQVQRFLRAFVDQLADVLAQRVGGFAAASRARPDDRPRRRACRPPASPGPGKTNANGFMLSVSGDRLASSDALRSRAAPRPR